MESASGTSLAVDLVVTAARLTRSAARHAEVAEPTAVWRALSILEVHGPVRVSTFAELDRCTQPTARALIARLATEGSVVKIPRTGARPWSASARPVASGSPHCERPSPPA